MLRGYCCFSLKGITEAWKTKITAYLSVSLTRSQAKIGRLFVFNIVTTSQVKFIFKLICKLSNT